MKCHGEAGQGGAAPEEDYDAWTMERLDAERLAEASTPEAASRLRAVLSREFPAREARAQAIASRVLRGGQDPMDLYCRVHQGIAGTPMPATGGRRPGEASALTEDEVAALAAYVASIAQSEREAP